MQDLNDYFSSVSTESRFQCNLGELGGFINFTNSGQRGLKEFTVSLQSILNGLQDIVDNIHIFENHSNYDEKTWRDLGSKYFTDRILQSMITVQTKPCFTTFSKVISWANGVDPSEYDDNFIDLEANSLNNAITKINNLSQVFTPTNTNQSLPKSKIDQHTAIISEKFIAAFVHKLLDFLIEENIEEPFFDYLVPDTKNPERYSIEFGDEL